MEYIDLVERLVPSPLTTIVVETPTSLVLVDSARPPQEGDTVLLADDSLQAHQATAVPVGVAYCVIRFMGFAVWISAQISHS